MTRATPRLRITDGQTYPVEVTGPDEQEKKRRQALWNAAAEAADGDTRRLRMEADGSITILDEPRRIFLVRLRGLTGTSRNP